MPPLKLGIAQLDWIESVWWGESAGASCRASPPPFCTDISRRIAEALETGTKFECRLLSELLETRMLADSSIVNCFPALGRLAMSKRLCFCFLLPLLLLLLLLLLLELKLFLNAIKREKEPVTNRVGLVSQSLRSDKTGDAAVLSVSFSISLLSFFLAVSVFSSPDSLNSAVKILNQKNRKEIKEKIIRPWCCYCCCCCCCC